MAWALLGPAGLAADAGAGAEPWHDTPGSRLAALALIETLNAELLASPSATLTLESWCAAHAMAEPARLQAEPLSAVADEADPEVRQDLRLQPGELVVHRRVALRCGAHLLSVADNWYVPARLSAAMNEQIEHSQVPFGTVVQALQPYRRTLAARLLWSPLPVGWEQRPGKAGAPVLPAAPAARAAGPLLPPQELFEHRALMSGSDHRPIAELRETYQRGVLEFAEPPAR